MLEFLTGITKIVKVDELGCCFENKSSVKQHRGLLQTSQDRWTNVQENNHEVHKLKECKDCLRQQKTEKFKQYRT